MSSTITMNSLNNFSKYDIDKMVQIYINSFPKDKYSLLGQKSCSIFFSKIINNPAIEIITERINSEIIGFAILHYDRSLPFKISISKFQIIKLFVLYPHIFFHLVKQKLCIILPTKKSNPDDNQWNIFNKDKINSVYIYKLAIDKSHRGKGYGKKLLAKIIKTSTILNKNVILLTVNNENTNAINLYKRIGFIQKSISDDFRSIGFVKLI